MTCKRVSRREIAEVGSLVSRLETKRNEGVVTSKPSHVDVARPIHVNNRAEQRAMMRSVQRPCGEKTTSIFGIVLGFSAVAIAGIDSGRGVSREILETVSLNHRPGPAF